MPSMLCTSISAAVGAGLAITVQPALGEAYCVTEVGNDALFINDMPDIQVEGVDLTHTAAVIILDPNTEARKGGRPKEIYINNDAYLDIRNSGGAGMNVSWTGYRVDPNIVISDIETVPASAIYDIRPPAGEVWRITEVGAETVTLAANNHPDLEFRIATATLTASIVMSEVDDLKQEKLLDWYIDHDTWIQVLDLSAGDNDMFWSGVRVDVEHVGTVVDVGAGLTLDILPPDGSEFVITDFSAESWGAPVAAPASAPDMLVSLFNGTVLSDIMEAGSIAVSLMGNRSIHLEIDHDVYIRITDVSGGNNEIGYIGYVRREYNP